MNIKIGLRKILIFFGILLSIYLLFSISCVYIALQDGLTISASLQEHFKNKQTKSQDQYVIGIIAPCRKGEVQQALMVQEAAAKSNQLSYVYAINDLDMDFFLPAKYINAFIIKILDFLFKTDFHLIMSFHVNLPVPEPNIMYISVPKNYLLNGKLAQFPTIKNYNNFLDINLLNLKEGIMRDVLDKEVESSYGLVGIPANEYKSSNRQRLLMFGSIWGRATDGFYGALNELAKQDYMYFIKHPLLLLAKDHPQKFIEEKANNLPKLQQALNEYGIAICIHSKYHVEAGIPSSRIFEIISSGAIVISDRNPFVVKYFADNVLYFDPNLSKEEVFKQIDNHVIWVRAHPEEAEKMARNAHKIVQDNFTTEYFIRDLINFYQTIDLGSVLIVNKNRI